ncbi:MAG: hypothetical protein ACKVVT_04820 [Dehalococcoidia bacterium]
MLPGLDNDMHFTDVLRSARAEAEQVVAAQHAVQRQQSRRWTRPPGLVVRWVGAWRLGHRPLG